MRPALLLLGALLVPACARSVRPEVETGSAPGTLVIAHTNDLHAHFLPNRAQWLEGEPDIGGMVALSAHLEELRRQRGADSVLYLDGGDLLSGTPLMELEVDGANGGAIVALLEELGCSAWVLGNHEFDRGYDNLEALVSSSDVPVLSANVDGKGTGDPAFSRQLDHVVLEANGLRVGIFGLTTPGLHRLASVDTMSRLEVQELAETARAQVAALDADTDLIVALTHIGLDSDRSLAQEVAGIDLIVGGHSHTAMAAPEQVGSTWIVQAGSYARQLGVVELNVQDDAIASMAWELRDLVPTALPGPPEPAVEAAVRDLQGELSRRFDVVAGEATAPIERGQGETGLGRLASDIVREAAGTDIGVYNSGGLRSDLVAGSLTRSDLYEVFPFGNQVVSMEVSGDELVGALLRSVYGAWGARSPMLQWSGVEVAWRERMGAPELLEVKVGGEPLDFSRSYRLATNSYIAEQWGHHLGFVPRDLRGHELTVFQAALLRAEAGPLSPPDDPRLIQR